MAFFFHFPAFCKKERSHVEIFFQKIRTKLWHLQKSATPKQEFGKPGQRPQGLSTLYACTNRGVESSAHHCGRYRQPLIITRAIMRDGSYRKTTSPPSTFTNTWFPSETLPSRIFTASLSWMRCWMVLLRGLAP